MKRRAMIAGLLAFIGGTRLQAQAKPKVSVQIDGATFMKLYRARIAAQEDVRGLILGNAEGTAAAPGSLMVWGRVTLVVPR